MYKYVIEILNKKKYQNDYKHKIPSTMCSLNCNGICERYRAKRNPEFPTRYPEGQKRCTLCEIFIKWDDNLYCPCCNHRLRTKPYRKGLMREKYREATIKRY